MKASLGQPQELANTAWAFATLGQHDTQLFTALAKEAQRCMGNFNPQSLANTALAFAKVHNTSKAHSRKNNLKKKSKNKNKQQQATRTRTRTSNKNKEKNRQ